MPMEVALFRLRKKMTKQQIAVALGLQHDPSGRILPEGVFHRRGIQIGSMVGTDTFMLSLYMPALHKKAGMFADCLGFS